MWYIRVRPIDAESRTAVTGDGEVKKNGERLIKGYKLRRMNTFRDLMHSMRTIAHMTVLNTRNLFRPQISGVLTTKKSVN